MTSATETREPVPPSVEGRGAATRAAILERAVDLASAEGLDGLWTADIVDGALNGKARLGRAAFGIGQVDFGS